MNSRVSRDRESAGRLTVDAPLVFVMTGLPSRLQHSEWTLAGKFEPGKKRPIVLWEIHRRGRNDQLEVPMRRARRPRATSKSGGHERRSALLRLRELNPVAVVDGGAKAA